MVREFIGQHEELVVRATDEVFLGYLTAREPISHIPGGCRFQLVHNDYLAVRFEGGTVPRGRYALKLVYDPEPVPSPPKTQVVEEPLKVSGMGFLERLGVAVRVLFGIDP